MIQKTKIWIKFSITAKNDVLKSVGHNWDTKSGKND